MTFESAEANTLAAFGSTLAREEAPQGLEADRPPSLLNRLGLETHATTAVDAPAAAGCRSSASLVASSCERYLTWDLFFMHLQRGLDQNEKAPGPTSLKGGL